VKVSRVAISAVSAALLATGVAGAKPAPVKVGVILKGLDNPFFVAIFEGARAEAKQLGVRLSVSAAVGNADASGQARRARALVASSHDCYVANPLNVTNLVSALRGVEQPIVNVDSPIDRKAAKKAGLHIRTYVGTNDFEAGRVAGAGMASLLRGAGSVAVIGGPPRNANSDLRLNGFASGVKRTNVRIVQRAYADYERTKAQLAAERILRAHPGIRGFFAVNDLMALGIADALRAGGKTGTVAIIGVDGIPEALDAIRTGAVTATVSQYPYVMGQMAIEACTVAARKMKTPQRVDAPIQLVTKANAARAVAAYPHPFARYSDPFSRLLRRR
jgi:ABC-type sugar transport system substrate-binding protein